MELTRQEVKLIQESWDQVAPQADMVADLFYNHLFLLDPNLEALFHNDMRRQGEKLTAMLGMLVLELDDLAQTLPTMRRLGETHAGYGVKAQHYTTVGEALLWTLQMGLGDAFTPETEAAWYKMYEWVATAMQS